MKDQSFLGRLLRRETDLSELGVATVAQLCDAREAINAELHRRALRSAESREFPVHAVGSSRTTLSYDGQSVLVQLLRSPDRFSAIMTHRAERFPVEQIEPQSYHVAAEDEMPLAVYEGGPSALAEWADEQKRQRDAEREKWQREEYERLRAKFEGTAP